MPWCLLTECTNGNLPFLKKHIEAGANPNVVGIFGKTLLMLACENNHQEVVKFLLDHGADPFVETLDGSTALSMALEKARNTEIINLLTDKGCDTIQGLTLKQIFKLLKCLSEEYSNKYTNVPADLDISDQTKTQWLDVIVSEGFSVGEIISDGYFLLDESCCSGDASRVRYLIEECGLDANGSGEDMSLLSCCRYGKVEVLMVLIELGATKAADDSFLRLCSNPDIPNWQELTTLLVTGNCIDIKNTNGLGSQANNLSYLGHAYDSENPEMEKLLLNLGATISIEECLVSEHFDNDSDKKYIHRLESLVKQNALTAKFNHCYWIDSKKLTYFLFRKRLNSIVPSRLMYLLSIGYKFDISDITSMLLTDYYCHIPDENYAQDIDEQIIELQTFLGKQFPSLLKLSVTYIRDRLGSGL